MQTYLDGPNRLGRVIPVRPLMPVRVHLSAPGRHTLRQNLHHPRRLPPRSTETDGHHFFVFFPFSVFFVGRLGRRFFSWAQSSVRLCASGLENRAYFEA